MSNNLTKREIVQKIYETHNFNHKDVFEIYTNGYRRVYDLQKKEKHNIFASEDAANGMYYVTIRLGKDESSVTVVTPLVTYIDSNSQKIK